MGAFWFRCRIAITLSSQWCASSDDVQRFIALTSPQSQADHDPQADADATTTTPYRGTKTPASSIGISFESPTPLTKIAHIFVRDGTLPPCEGHARRVSSMLRPCPPVEINTVLPRRLEFKNNPLLIRLLLAMRGGLEVQRRVCFLARAS